MRSPSEDSPGQIGRYTLLEPLGSGGMARVFLAQKQGAADACVLKRLHLQLESNELALKRFQREAHIASLLDHRAIARVIDAGIEDGSFCIAMEYIAGHTLEAILDRLARLGRKLPLPIALLVARETLDGLAYAHDFTDGEGRPLQIVHRDLTPRNVMVSYGGQVKIIDFGIARGDVDELKTAPGVLMGTPYYMSPEQANTVPVDRRSDLYTFGAVFFEMLAGRRLVRGKGRASILAEVATTPAPLISTLNPEVPKIFDPVLSRVLDKDREKRPATAQELERELLAAAHPIAPASPEELGRLLRELFPEAEAKAAERIKQLRSSASSEIETTVERPFHSHSAGSGHLSKRTDRRRRRSQPLLLAALVGGVVPAAAAATYLVLDERTPTVIERPVSGPAAIVQPKAQALPVEPPAEPVDVEDPPVLPRREKRERVRPDPPPPQPEEARPDPRVARVDELARLLEKLRASPKDARLRTQLYDRIDAEAAKLPAPRQRLIRAAIDRALLDEDVEGLERGIAELRRAITAGEMP